MKFVQKIHRRQRTRHVIANKLQLALTVLRELEDGRVVPRKLAEKAIKDLEAVIEWVDDSGKK